MIRFVQFSWFTFFLLGFRAVSSWAFSLPPKIQKYDYSRVENLRTLRELRAERLVWVSKDPVIHGLMKVQGGKIQVVNADGTEVTEYSLAGGTSQKRAISDVELERSYSNLISIEGEMFPTSGGGFLEGLGSALIYRMGNSGRSQEIWRVPLGYTPSGRERFPSFQSLMGWGARPAQLFYFPSDLSVIHLFDWTADSIPLRFFPCGPRHQILAENLINGFSRLTFFSAEKPVGWTVFDFSGQGQGSQMSRVEAISCQEFVAAGSFGVVRATYPAGALQ